MGTLIDMVAVARPHSRFYPSNSIKLSARAARQCMVDSGIGPGDLGLIINTGIYRHRNIGEPSVAALIQEMISTKRAKNVSSCNSNNTFSFDLNNGVCGMLTAIEIVHGSLNNHEISYGMVVAGDSEPFPGLSNNFNINSAAAAIILSKSNDSKGFSLFRTYHYPEFSEEFRSCTLYNITGNNGKGRNILNIFQKESYLDFCVDCAAKSLFNFLDESGRALDEIDLIIPSQSPPGFIDKMKNHFGMNDNFIELSNKGNKAFHTAGPAFALKKVWDDNRFRNSKNIIFLTVGSGISVSITLYIN
jgi:3-oxoacyl-[acyl-carrier-protein] synthase-3